MAISSMTKVLISGHKSIVNDLVKDLQSAAVLHVNNISDKFSLDKSTQDRLQFELKSEQKKKLEEAKIYLEQYRKNETLLDKLVTPLRLFNRKSFDDIVYSYDIDSLLDSILRIKDREIQLENEKISLIKENIYLEPWKNIFYSLADRGITGKSYVTAGVLNRKNYEKFVQIENTETLVLDKHKDIYAIVAACGVENMDRIEAGLHELGFHEFEFKDMEKSPAEKYSSNKIRIREIDVESSEMELLGNSLADSFDKLIVFLENYGNMENRNRLFEYWISTENAFLISGWIRTSDLEKFSNIIFSYKNVFFEELMPEANESPPVTFENKKIFSPFQFITRLYSYPVYGSLDPAPLTSFFFVIFFGVCLTDAGYGLILSLLAFVGLKKFSGNRDLLWILFWGGIFTIFTGILTGGIFGDLFRSEDPFVSIPMISSLREKMIWFDPMKDPMVFFRLVLFLGVVQVLTGLLAGFYVKIKMRRVVDALVENAAWIFMLTAILTLMLSSDISLKMSLVTSASPLLGSAFIAPSYGVISAMSIVIILFGARNEKSFIFRLFIGLLKLLVLSGIFSYMGDILSYIRLMALGMVTAGIAMAVNTIAFMMADIPIVGYFLTGIILAAGHLFNLAINLLGGFVHTLRLQYVEFYSRFFIGGGKPFLPFSNNEKYIKIIE